LGTVGGRYYTDPRKTERFSQIFGSLSIVSDEVDALQLELQQPGEELVFCHNDLLCGNLIYDSVTERVSMVDFEYGGPNCAAYDIGNHFCEFAGINEPVDYDRYPSEAVQYKWIRYYLQECAKIKGGDPNALTEREVRRLYVEANKYALAAHLFWTVWALVQAAQSSIDFDYIEYAGVRFSEYRRRKELFLNLTLNTHGSIF
jgi:ethanolamine kinase